MTTQAQTQETACDDKLTVHPDELVEATSVAPSSAEDLRIVAEPPRVMRLSRKTLAALGFAASLGIGGSLIYALQPKDDATPENLIDTNSRNRADQVTGAPASYSDVPKLGPPLADGGGDLIGLGQQDGQNVPIPPIEPPANETPPPDPRIAAAGQARERAAQERDSARTSQLFLASSSRGGEVRPSASSIQHLQLSTLQVTQRRPLRPPQRQAARRFSGDLAIGAWKVPNASCVLVRPMWCKPEA